MSILLKNAKIFINNEFVSRDVLIEGDKIAEIGTNICSADKVYDVNGMWVIAGAVDVHAHLREPGFENKETVATGTLSAAKGGVTTIMPMPNLNPVPDSIEHLNVELNALKNSLVRAYPFGAVTVGENGKEMANIEELCSCVRALTDDGKCVNDLAILKNAMQIAKKYDKIIASHAEADGYKDGAEEYVAVEREIALVRETGVKYHFCHMSTAKSFELIREAKKEGLDVTCEVCPHHLLLNIDDIQGRTSYKMNPPLRKESDRQATIQALLDGTVDMFATDHAPHTREEKARPYDKAPNGIIGFETLIPSLYTNFVRTGLITPDRFTELLTYAPARRFELACGELKVGALADIAVIDTDNARVYEESEILSKANNTPFIGTEFYGYVALTLVGGQVIYDRNLF